MHQTSSLPVLQDLTMKKKLEKDDIRRRDFDRKL
jgi:hypothetical protein